MHCIILVYYRPNGSQGSAYALEEGQLEDYDQAVATAALLNANKSTPAISYQLVSCGGQTCRDVIQCQRWQTGQGGEE